MPDIHGLKKDRLRVVGYGCEITTSVLIREPTSQTLSFYEYYIREAARARSGRDEKDVARGCREGKAGDTISTLRTAGERQTDK